MLRIAGNKPPVPEEPMPEEMPVEEPMPEEMMAEEEVPMEEGLEQPEGGMLDPMIAGYKGPEMGPFMCANCQYFSEGTCAIVAGPVDDMGLCNLFTPVPQEEEMPVDEEELPMEEPMPEEAPAEEVPMEEDEA